MSFDISFLNEKTNDNNEVGSIVVGDFTEDLIIPTSAWQRQEYEKQWRKSLQSIVQGNALSSGLITEIYPEGAAEYVNIWPIYRVGDEVYIQNRMLFLNDYPGFKQENLMDYVGERELIDSEGNKISEWKTGIGDIKKWLDQSNIA